MNHPIKMIVSDLDGTLLRTDKSISEHTKSVLALCRKSGIKVVYATGRGGSADRVAPSGFFDGKITMNGAVAKISSAAKYTDSAITDSPAFDFTSADFTIVYNRLIPYQTARPLLIACDKRGLKITSEMSGMHYSNFDVSAKWPNFINSEEFKITDFSQHDIDAEKIYSTDLTPEDVLFIKKQLPDTLHFIMARDGLAQIMHKEATKSKAIAELAHIWGIAPSEIVAFGDDLNDIDMLSFVGIGVAMENALDEVKSVSDFVCLSNDEDGLAKWIEKLLT